MGHWTAWSRPATATWTRGGRGSTLRGLSGLHLDDLADTLIESVQAMAVRVPPSAVAAAAPLVEGDRDDIALVLLRHTDGDALLVAEPSGPPGDRLLRVEVSDPSDQLPHLREPGELASSGRGLLLMDSLGPLRGGRPGGPPA